MEWKKSLLKGGRTSYENSSASCVPSGCAQPAESDPGLKSGAGIRDAFSIDQVKLPITFIHIDYGHNSAGCLESSLRRRVRLRVAGVAQQSGAHSGRQHAVDGGWLHSAMLRAAPARTDPSRTLYEPKPLIDEIEKDLID